MDSRPRTPDPDNCESLGAPVHGKRHITAFRDSLTVLANLRPGANASRTGSIMSNSSGNPAASAQYFQIQSTLQHHETVEGLIVDRLQVGADFICSWLHQQQLERMWCTSHAEQGVILKQRHDRFICCPQDLSCRRDVFFDAVCSLNVKVSAKPCI